MRLVLLLSLIFVTSVQAQVFTPKQAPKHLFVFLHGCKMDGKTFFETTNIKPLLEQKNIAAFYPSQSIYANIDHCWNWFFPINQTRSLSLENITIMSDVKKLQTKFNIAADKTFMIGLSAGAAQASNLISCFPDMFGGVVLHSGLSYLASSDISTASDVLLNGPELSPTETARRAIACGGILRKPIKTLLIHGKMDTRVKPVNFFHLQDHFVAFHDLLDDGEINQSFPKLIQTKTIQTPGRYSYKETKFDDVIQSLYIDELKHQWSGGKSGMTYSDPNGPDINQIIIQLLF